MGRTPMTDTNSATSDAVSHAPDVDRSAENVRDLVEIDAHGCLHLHPHRGQARAYISQRRFVLMLAGTQSGKTTFGPHWLYREIERCGQGDYLVVAPTYPLLDLKALPAFLALFGRYLNLGQYVTTPSRKFIFDPAAERELFGQRYDQNKSTRVIFGYATEPESLESSTINAAWLDEAGQKRFKLDSWEAIRRRLTIARGRVLVTTSLYTNNWVKTLYDRAQTGDKSIDIIQFDSTANPRFSPAEFEDARRTLPSWKFNMHFRGRFDRPAGLIYDCLDPAVHFIPRFTIPSNWLRYQGLDFGTHNMASVFAAEEPGTKRLFIYRIYHEGSRSTPGHVSEMRRGEQGGLPNAVGGAPSEDAWRREFRRAGLPVKRPYIVDVELGIDYVYGALQGNKLIFFDDLFELKEDLLTYSRKLNDRLEPTDEIEDKNEYHLLDCLRYLVSEWATKHLRIARCGSNGLYDRNRRPTSRAPSQPVYPARTEEEVDAMLREQAERLSRQ